MKFTKLSITLLCAVFVSTIFTSCEYLNAKQKQEKQEKQIVYKTLADQFCFKNVEVKITPLGIEKRNIIENYVVVQTKKKYGNETKKYLRMELLTSVMSAKDAIALKNVGIPAPTINKITSTILDSQATMFQGQIENEEGIINYSYREFGGNIAAINMTKDNWIAVNFVGKKYLAHELLIRLQRISQN